MSPLLLSQNTSSERMASPDDTQSQRSRGQAQKTEIFLFFLCGVGSTVGWTAVLSSLVFYSETLGMNSFLYLNLAVFFPMLPVTMAQARWDSYFDRQFNSLRTYSFRGEFGFAFSLLSVLLIPLVSYNLALLSLVTFALGLAASVLHGTMKQMACFVYPECKTLPAAVSGGMQASAGLVLVASMLTGFWGSSASSGLVPFYLSIAGIVVLCWVGFAILMRHSHGVWLSMRQRDSSIGASVMMAYYSSTERMSEPLLTQGTEQNTSDGELDADESPLLENEEQSLNINGELTSKEIWLKTWPACAALMVTVASSMSVASWFNRFTSTNPSNHSLPQILFYTRLFSDLLGRPATLLLKPSSISCVGFLAIVRSCCCPYFFLYASAWGEDTLPRSDFAITLGVAAFAFTSGYFATACYQLAPDLLSSLEGQVVDGSIPKQTSLVNVCFSSSILLGLGISFALLGAGL